MFGIANLMFFIRCDTDTSHNLPKRYAANLYLEWNRPSLLLDCF